MKYVKVMFGTTSGADKNLEYKIGEVNIASKWNPKAKEPKDIGGFNFCEETAIIRWLVRGDTIYDVTIPEDAEVVDHSAPVCPGAVLITNKIIFSNPRLVTDEMAMEFYLKAKLFPEKHYFKAMAGVAIRGFANTAKKIFRDRVNKDNIDLEITEFEDLCTYKGTVPFNKNNLGETAKEIYDRLIEYQTMKIELKQLNVNFGRLEYDMLQKIEDGENGFSNPAYGVSYEEYQEWLKRENDYSIGKNLPEGWIPCTTYFLYINDIPVGYGRVRHSSNDYLENVVGTGNLGYGIAKDNRDKGYGKILFGELLKKCREMGYDEIKLFPYKNNIPTIKIMQSYGGEIIGELNQEKYKLVVKLKREG